MNLSPQRPVTLLSQATEAAVPERPARTLLSMAALSVTIAVAGEWITGARRARQPTR